MESHVGAILCSRPRTQFVRYFKMAAPYSGEVTEGRPYMMANDYEIALQAPTSARCANYIDLKEK